MKKGTKKSNNFKFGAFLKEKQVGSLFDKFDDVLTKVDHEYVEIGTFIQDLLSTKEQEDILKIKSSATLAVHYAKQLVNLMEDAIDQDEKVRHSALTNKIEQSIEADGPKLERKFSIHSKFFDLSYMPIVQSGGVYDLRPNAESNNEYLSYNVIMLSVGAKYFEFNSNVVRTYFIDATKEEKAAYLVLYEAHRLLCRSLVPGVQLKKVYEEVINFVKSKAPSYEGLLPPNLGFGIGYEFRETVLSISPKNERVVKIGMIFNANISMKNLKSLGNKREASIMIADTVIVTKEGPLNATDSLPKLYDDVGYSLNDDDGETSQDQKKEKPAPKVHMDEKYINAAGIQTRARRRGNNDDKSNWQLIREHQKDLLDKKMEEIEERFKSGNFIFKGSSKAEQQLEKIQTYSHPSKLPKIPNQNRIFLDEHNMSVFLPVNGKMVPFHIAIIKNLNKQQEGQVHSLRFNFNIPGKYFI